MSEIRIVRRDPPAPAALQIIGRFNELDLADIKLLPNRRWDPAILAWNILDHDVDAAVLSLTQLGHHVTVLPPPIQRIADLEERVLTLENLLLSLKRHNAR